MALTPEDVVNKRFQPTKFREGYDQDEVDDFLDEIVVELRRLTQENEELRKELAAKGGDVVVVESVTEETTAAAAEEAPKPEPVREEAPKAAPAVAEPAPVTSAIPASAESAAGLLAMAQQMHDKHVADGAAQRDKIIAEAQIEASTLVNDAQEKSRQVLGVLEQQRSVLERKVDQLRGFERDYRSRLKTYIEGQLRDLESRGSVAAENSEQGSES
ncbi:DivIVA domain-containing protein [Arthrobacter sp. Y-9]|uniref:DivIVA domain-containing protein n=1 Tax=Arthrobacter sp. Y-9 TaxID=3039385 RepID=UPI00241E713B|nr:DivIVA domain-containing protein [Arthrobacter sp. Y-9]WFR85299.1 DivIVA domain-containing protein [Arthrobacter sp. Y-9]